MSKSITIAHLYPELLNLYGDSGNILTLCKRLEWRGIRACVHELSFGEKLSLADADIVFIGGGSDREQKIVCKELLKQKEELQAYVEDFGVVAAVCGGYQLLGHSYTMGDEVLEGLSLVDLYTDRGTPRIIGNIIVDSPLCTHPIVGYENHGGRTHLGDGVSALGKVRYGGGNDGVSGYEGVLYKNVVGTYIHGPLLPKNPGVADWLLSRSLERKYGQGELADLDDSVELSANKYQVQRLLAGKVEEA